MSKKIFRDSNISNRSPYSHSSSRGQQLLKKSDYYDNSLPLVNSVTLSGFTFKDSILNRNTDREKGLVKNNLNESNSSNSLKNIEKTLNGLYEKVKTEIGNPDKKSQYPIFNI